MISTFKKPDEQKIQLTMKPKFMSSTCSNEKQTLHAKCDNIGIMIGKDTDEITEFFDFAFK